ncbi:MAG: hypothetical protein A3A44_02065 [Candidatus Sungbacteria bacterium RIFCSPLOWO2_01_FULL_60_25]|uniref:Uncharacterized protein n=1 Tax=Candidatus Sungbacteria bacterium RIFCSPLOWO2_01_FULL_60_25 TaxID=1802281 RepID=A0A1G2LDN0_9BACT|nr:MAG: hypothetical protein A3A44_02065 [Candidatus Sungbacteria bacterium RIFCSPLOWO2_01_FULL_60_25]
MESENKDAFDFSKALANTRSGAQHQNKLQSAGYGPEASGMVGWVIRHSGGLIQDERQASFVLLGFVAVVIAVSLYLFFSAGAGTQQQFTPENFTPITRPTVSP